jgi:hypothetical protein
MEAADACRKIVRQYNPIHASYVSVRQEIFLAAKGGGSHQWKVGAQTVAAGITPKLPPVAVFFGLLAFWKCPQVSPFRWVIDIKHQKHREALPPN